MEQIARDPRADFLAVYNRSIGRNGRTALLYWLENETDFFTAPASSKNHLAQPGGLTIHSLNVWRRLREITVRDMTCRSRKGSGRNAGKLDGFLKLRLPQLPPAL